ncbi:hypothetical protein CRYUN_Cryun14cG0053900 [Craigia yunnanensis]
MTRRQLEEMRAQADTSKGNSELGRLIVKECFEGRLSRVVIVGQDHVLENSRSRRLSLSTIDEEGIGNEGCVWDLSPTHASQGGVSKSNEFYGTVSSTQRIAYQSLRKNRDWKVGHGKLALEIYRAVGDSENVLESSIILGLIPNLVR